MRAQPLVDLTQARRIIGAYAIEDMRRRRIASSFEGAEPALQFLPLGDQRRQVVQRTIRFRHHQDPYCSSLRRKDYGFWPRSAITSAALNSFTVPSERATNTMRAACSRLSIR